MKTSWMRDEIGVFCQCVLLYTKPPGKTSAPSLDVQLYAGEVQGGRDGIYRAALSKVCSAPETEPGDT